jgi:hypothetical protein
MELEHHERDIIKAALKDHIEKIENEDNLTKQT